MVFAHARSRTCILFLFAALILCAVPISPSAAASAESWRFNDYAAGGDYYSADGCVVTETHLNAFTDGESPQAYVFYDHSVYDYCTDTLLEGVAGNGGGTLNVDGSLSTASLTATITVYDYVTGTEESLTINETFTAVGPRYRSRESHSYGIPGQYQVVTKTNGVSRTATATGTVELDSAYIGQVKQGAVFVSH
jgi:hypothetical protein